MSILCLLRHGQASFAAEDYDRLSPLGERQARATGAHFATGGARFDRVLTGPRRRHASTAAIALAAMANGMTAESDDGLDEFADGNQILHYASERHEQRRGETPSPSRAEQVSRYADTIRRWTRGEITLEGCPNAMEFFACACAWLAELRRQTSRSQRVLAVSSAGTIAMLVCAALDLPVVRSAELMLAQGNASISEIAFSGERVGLRSFNGSAHLSPELQSML